MNLFSTFGINTAAAVAAIAGTLFYHPLGMMLSAIHDMGLNLHQVYELLSHGEYTQSAKEVLSLLNNSFYFMLLIYGALEIYLASLIMQIVFKSASAVDEYKKGK